MSNLDERVAMALALNPSAIFVDLAQDWKARGAELERLQQWVRDLQSGMYIACVYCGHRYEVPATMEDALKDHMERCDKHPMSALKEELARLRSMPERVREACAKEAEELNSHYFGFTGTLYKSNVEEAIRALDLSKLGADDEH